MATKYHVFRTLYYEIFKCNRKISSKRICFYWYFYLASSTLLYLSGCNISRLFIFQRVHLQAKQFRPKPLVVFGISTISRGSEEHSYLRHTLTSLRNHLKKDEKSQCLFVIQVAEVGNHKKGIMESKAIKSCNFKYGILLPKVVLTYCEKKLFE